MLTPEIEAWLLTLNDTNHMEIFPYDPTCVQKFELIRDKIRRHMGEETEVVHGGASSLGISGQKEIDVYVPVPAAKLTAAVAALTEVFGKPGNAYPDRIRFRGKVEDTKIDLFAINKASSDWLNHNAFMQHLARDPAALSAYARLKEEASGCSTREYYRRKNEFLYSILELTKTK